jgi:hypothetical protein
MPVREDGWRPTDVVFEGIIKRCVEDAEAGAARDGTRELMAGGLILTVLLVGLLAAGQPAAFAIALAAGLFLLGAIYLVNASNPAPIERHRALDPIGGPGGLPAGYLVHPRAWQGGMAEYVAYLPESQLKASADLCRQFPGSVHDLIIFTGTIAAALPASRTSSPNDVQRRARDLVRVGMPVLKDYNDRYPPMMPSASGGKKGKKK